MVYISKTPAQSREQLPSLMGACREDWRIVGHLQLREERHARPSLLGPTLVQVLPTLHLCKRAPCSTVRRQPLPAHFHGRMSTCDGASAGYGTAGNDGLPGDGTKCDGGKTSKDAEFDGTAADGWRRIHYVCRYHPDRKKLWCTAKSGQFGSCVRSAKPSCHWFAPHYGPL